MQGGASIEARRVERCDTLPLVRPFAPPEALNGMGLRARLLLLVLLAVLPGAVLSILTSAEQRRSERDRVEKDASRIVQLAAANQLALVNATRQHLEAVTRFPQAARGRDLAAYQLF